MMRRMAKRAVRAVVAWAMADEVDAGMAIVARLSERIADLEDAAVTPDEVKDLIADEFDSRERDDDLDGRIRDAVDDVVKDHRLVDEDDVDARIKDAIFERALVSVDDLNEFGVRLNTVERVLNVGSGAR